jgi:hypothetical protein
LKSSFVGRGKKGCASDGLGFAWKTGVHDRGAGLANLWDSRQNVPAHTIEQNPKLGGEARTCGSFVLPAAFPN